MCLVSCFCFLFGLFNEVVGREGDEGFVDVLIKFEDVFRLRSWINVLGMVEFYLGRFFGGKVSFVLGLKGYMF